MGDYIRKTLLGLAVALRAQAQKLILKLTPVGAESAGLSAKDNADADMESGAAVQAPKSPRLTAGPPKHWVERVKKYAPELLEPASPHVFSHEVHSPGSRDGDFSEADGGVTSGTPAGHEALIEEGEVSDQGAATTRGSGKEHEENVFFPRELPGRGDTGRTGPGNTGAVFGTRSAETRSARIWSDRSPSFPMERTHAPAQRQADTPLLERRPRTHESGEWQPRASAADSGNPRMDASPSISSRAVDAEYAGAPREESRSDVSKSDQVESLRSPLPVKTGDESGTGAPGSKVIAVKKQFQESGPPRTGSHRQRQTREIKASFSPRVFEKNPAGLDAKNGSFYPTAEGKIRPDTQNIPLNWQSKRQQVDDSAAEWDEPCWPDLPDEDPSGTGAIPGHSRHWPTLPEDFRASSVKDPDPQGVWGFMTEFHKIERLRRLDREQQGKSWNAWPF